MRPGAQLSPMRPPPSSTGVQTAPSATALALTGTQRSRGVPFCVPMVQRCPARQPVVGEDVAFGLEHDHVARRRQIERDR